MPLVYVTGISGSGKSTIRRALVSRGYEAYDVDEGGFRLWYNRDLDTPATEQKAWLDTTVAWRTRYWLKIDRSKVAALKARAKQQNVIIFLCGITPNDRDVWDLFDAIIALTIGDKALRYRLANRENDYGKHPDDLRDILAWNKGFSRYMTECKATLIDAEQPLEEVVEQVLTLAGITYEQLGKSKNGIEVIYDPHYSHAATHLEDTASLKALVTELVRSMHLEGDRIARSVDLDRVVGTCDVVTVDDTDEMVYAKRKNRESDGLVPFTMTRDPAPCRDVAIQLVRRADGRYELTSAWIGTFDDLPFPQAERANKKSIAYWSEHAFVWGSQEIIPGSETTKCPW